MEKGFAFFDTYLAGELGVVVYVSGRILDQITALGGGEARIWSLMCR